MKGKSEEILLQSILINLIPLPGQMMHRRPRNRRDDALQHLQEDHQIDVYVGSQRHQAAHQACNQVGVTEDLLRSILGG